MTSGWWVKQKAFNIFTYKSGKYFSHYGVVDEVVEKPTFLEKILFSITYEEKIALKKKKMEKLCETWNRLTKYKNIGVPPRN